METPTQEDFERYISYGEYYRNIVWNDEKGVFEYERRWKTDHCS